MIRTRIRTGSRLHFGLFSLPSERAGPWLNQEGEPTLPRRQFGGVGLMIDKPGIELTVEEATSWSAEGPLAERALAFAQTWCEAEGINEAFAIRVVRAAPEHAGLGTGTQLGLAVAHGVSKAHSPYGGHDLFAIAEQMRRGLRSAIGIHGFDNGGFIVEPGRAPDGAFSPRIFGDYFPAEWTILLIMPQGIHGVHGSQEIAAFARLFHQEQSDRFTESLCRIVLLGMLPAFDQLDLDTFGEALYDFNRRSGELFKTAQGGIYAHPRIEQIVRVLRNMSIKGVGQSSWGPTVFAVVRTEEASELCNVLSQRNDMGQNTIIATEALNCGAELTHEIS